MHRTFVIAEMACSHDGSVDLAKKIIDGAVDAGADAIQFQIWRHQDMVVPEHPDIDILRKIELSFDQWRELSEYVRFRSPQMEIIACVGDATCIDFSSELGVDAFKIHTSDLSNPRLIKKVSGLGKRIDLSVGASTYYEIAEAIDWIRSVNDIPIWLMYGKQLFPTNPSDAEILQAITLQDAFDLPVGYQDHSDGDSKEAFWLPLVARGAGLWIQEKHITHDRALKGIDHQAALNPDEFKEFVRAVRTVDCALGDGRPHVFSEADMKYRVYSKKSLVASISMKKGHVIQEGDLLALRATEQGLPPDRLDEVVGKTLQRPLTPFSALHEGDVA